MKKLKEHNKAKVWVTLIIIVAVILAVFDFPLYANKAISFLNEKYNKEYNLIVFPFHLGLDLQGGTHLVYEADTSHIAQGDRSGAIEGVRDVIERRVNALGVSEPVVQTNKSGDKWRVIVELAGIKDVSEAIDMIGETPLLEFKEENIDPARELTEEEQKQMDEFNAQVKQKADELQQKISEGQDFVKLVEEYNDDYRFPLGDITFVRENSEFSREFALAKDLENGQVSPVTETDEGYVVVRKIDEREQGSQVSANHILICWEGATMCEVQRSKEEALQKIQDLQNIVTPENFSEMTKENSDEPNAKNSGGDLGWVEKGMTVEPFENALFNLPIGKISDVVETEFGYHLIYKKDEQPIREIEMLRIFLDKKTRADIIPPADQWKNTELTGRNLKRSNVQFDPNTGEPQVSLEFDSDGRDLFADITERNVGRPVAIFLDGEPISVPTVQDTIREGKAVISGSFNLNEAKLLSQRLNAGALPVPINLVSQQTIGASLGHESVNRSLEAGIIGLLIVAFYLLIYYRLPGLMAVIALLAYGAIVLFLFKLIPVTLTLAGIAGFILSIGMAVDANVLIFERLREELAIGRSVRTAIEEAFKRAWPSIRDGNFSTLITCFILMWFGTSMIKGFAITLGIGILISMFSAIVITRLLMRVINPDKTQDKLWLLSRKSKNSEESI